MASISATGEHQHQNYFCAWDVGTYYGPAILAVNSVSVNYAIRFSGPVTPSPPAVSGMASDPASSASLALRQV
jgi:hypothetical protein